MKLNESQEAKVKTYIKKLIRESLETMDSFNQFEGDYKKDYPHKGENEKKPLHNPDGTSDQNNENEEEQLLRSSVEKFFKSTNSVGRKVDIAGYAYQLDGIKPTPGEDSNEMKNSRSLFMKKLNHEPNDQGYPYSFSTQEINRLASMISSNNKMNESIRKAVNYEINKVIKESFDKIDARDVHNDHDFDDLDDASKDNRMKDPEFWKGKRDKKNNNRGVCAHFACSEKTLEEIVAKSVKNVMKEINKKSK